MNGPRLPTGLGTIEHRVAVLERHVAPASSCTTCQGDAGWWLAQWLACARDEPTAWLTEAGRLVCPECHQPAGFTWQDVLRWAGDSPPGRGDLLGAGGAPAAPSSE